MNKNIVTVSQLNNYVKMLLETDENLRSIYLSGEISNFTNHYKSGHFYLSLKDDGAVIKAVMFKFNAQKIKFLPQDGMKVICKGRVSLYERDGNYQFYIEEMEPEGIGGLQLAFEQLCEKLKLEGLFDESHKKRIPKIPERIGIVTSATGAALQDMKNVISRRFPAVDVILFPVLVQGEFAADDMIKALDIIDENNLCDVVIIGRGGGSLEDLWAFNDEKLARRIYSLKTPIISAVGHEIDFTICDFVADLRAPTPSAAAELAVPDKNELNSYINGLLSGIKSSVKNKISLYKAQIERIENSSVLSNPTGYVNNLAQRLDNDEKHLINAYSLSLAKAEDRFLVNVAKLNAFSPLNTLSRGYALATKEGQIIKKAGSLKPNDNIRFMFSDGKADCTVNKILENNNG